jgi:hypothetical protein
MASRTCWTVAAARRPVQRRSTLRRPLWRRGSFTVCPLPLDPKVSRRLQQASHRRQVPTYKLVGRTFVAPGRSFPRAGTMTIGGQEGPTLTGRFRSSAPNLRVMSLASFMGPPCCQEHGNTSVAHVDRLGPGHWQTGGAWSRAAGKRRVMGGRELPSCAAQPHHIPRRGPVQLARRSSLHLESLRTPASRCHHICHGQRRGRVI